MNAISTRKLEQNIQVKNLRSKFKINVKVLNPNDAHERQPQEGGESPDLHKSSPK